MTGAANPEMPALRVDGLEAYYGPAQALFGVDLEVPEGSVTVLLGRNGAGKSTTMKAIMGLLKLGRGTVTVAGQEVTGWPAYRVNRAGVGYVPEERRVFAGLSVMENLLVGTRDADTSSRECWTHERVFDLFPPLAALRDRLAGQLSGGEQQMLTIARTLMGNPGIILLDEPSEGLAPVVVQQIATFVKHPVCSEPHRPAVGTECPVCDSCGRSGRRDRTGQNSGRRLDGRDCAGHAVA